MQTDEYRNIFEHQDSHWWYLGMRYINESFLLRYAPKKKNISILDVGCGSGAALRYLSKIGKTVGLDASNEAIKYARKRGEVVKGDIQSLPFPSSTFDIVTCMDVLYHQWVNNENKAIAEMHRVLKKGGTAMFSVPARFSFFVPVKFLQKLADFIFKTHFWRCGYEKSFTPWKFKRILKNSGFKIKKLEFNEISIGKRFSLVSRLIRILDKPFYWFGIGGRFMYAICEK